VTFWQIYLKDILEKLHNLENGNLTKLFNTFADKKGFMNREDFISMVSMFNAEIKDYEVEMLFRYFDPTNTL
jgi:Ca2+-binding EF-hand superfamily protein